MSAKNLTKDQTENRRIIVSARHGEAAYTAANKKREKKENIIDCIQVSL